MHLSEYFLYICVEKTKEMTCIVTGDVINSRGIDSNNWIKYLRKELRKYGKEPKDWEIFRGDSFQLEIEPKDGLIVGLILKAGIKQFKELDLRIGIGIGEKKFKSGKITQSNGSAFVNSGECFDNLKKHTLAIKTDFPEFDEQINLMLELFALVMDNWSPNSALVVKTALENPELNQEKIADLLGKRQSNISSAMKRSGYYPLLELLDFYTKKINKLC